MDSSKKLDDLIHDKEFLKRNDLADLLARGMRFITAYKVPIFILAVLALFLLIGTQVYNYYRGTRTVALSDKLYEAQKSLKKEALYQDIVKDYPGVPAARLAHLKLADHYMDNADPAKARAVLEQGLANDTVDVLSTMLVVKTIGVFQSEKKFKEALDFAKAHEGKVLPAFVGQLKLLEAELALSAGRRDEAKSLYAALAATPMDVKPGEDKAGRFDPQVVDQAKEQLLLMDLGLL